MEALFELFLLKHDAKKRVRTAWAWAERKKNSPVDCFSEEPAGAQAGVKGSAIKKRTL
jgi:hypothetical protein